LESDALPLELLACVREIFNADAALAASALHYLDSRCFVCFPQKGQNLLNSSFVVVFFLFF